MPKAKSGWQFIILKRPSHWIQTFWMHTSIWAMCWKRPAYLIGKWFCYLFWYYISTGQKIHSVQFNMMPIYFHVNLFKIRKIYALIRWIYAKQKVCWRPANWTIWQLPILYMIILKLHSHIYHVSIDYRNRILAHSANHPPHSTLQKEKKTFNVCIISANGNRN